MDSNSMGFLLRVSQDHKLGREKPPDDHIKAELMSTGGGDPDLEGL